MINTWFKFEEKIQNLSKVIVFTRNHTDDDDDAVDDGTKTNVSPPSRGGGDIIQGIGYPDFSKDYSFLSFKREKKGVIHLLFPVQPILQDAPKNSQNSE